MSFKNENIQKEINLLIERFMDPNSLQFVAQSFFKKGIDIPSDKWSTLNRLIMFAHNSLDARGAKAWFKIGRKVTKGNHFCILAPKLRSFKKENTTGGEDEIVTICNGFYPIAVWPAEKTVGNKDIDYKMDKEMPLFLGKEICEEWGIKISQIFDNGRFQGSYNPVKNEIRMATDDQQTFFHELVHAADNRIYKNKKFKGKNNDEEIIAEFSSVILMGMFGLRCGTKNAYDYIKIYADKMDKDPVDSIIPLISRISKIINLIMETNEKISKRLVLLK